MRLFLKPGFLGLVSFMFANTISTAQVTPEHIAQMKTVIGSVISEDSKHIAYTLSVPADPRKENAHSQAHLYVLNTNTDENKLYFSGSSVSQVHFRPVKGSVTFLTRKAGEKTNSLYEIRLNGGEAEKIFTHSSNILNYSWSPDGENLVFVTSEKGQQTKTSLTYSPVFFEEEYSNRNAYVTAISNGSSASQKINAEGSVYMVHWSPDGKKIALSVAPTSSVDDSYMGQKVKIVSAASGNVTAHIDNEGKLGQIEWSPDGKYLALVSAFDLHDPTSGSIFIVSAEGGKPQVIDGGYLGKYESVLWQDKQVIHFHSSEGTASVLGTIRVDGRNKVNIIRLDKHQITSFSRAKNGMISFTASSPDHPTEVFTLAGSKKAAFGRRTWSNPWLQGLKLGKQEVISYKARDHKYEIQGMLIYPIGYKENTRVPLITVVHGGPESHYSNGWLTAYSMPGQMAAAKGYAVFYPNYRGSTGRGTDFTYSSQSDLAGKEFDDIVDGIDYLIEKGIADSKRVGVTGGSYGGYASAWMSTYYSDRFAAAVMFVGISNNISKFGTSDIPNEMFLVHSRKRVWDDWKWQLERSPIYYADRAQTPILIMHGAEDPRVHPAQSMELYRHLKVRRPEVPVRLIYYPGEGHGNARSGSRYDYNLRMMQWFDVYLKTGNPKEKMPDLDLPEKTDEIFY